MPALRALRSSFPGAHLTLAAHGAAARLLETTGEVDQGVPFDSPGLAWAVEADAPAPSRLPDALVAWQSDPRGTVEALLHSRGLGRVVVAPSRPAEGDRTHCAVHLLRTLRPLGVRQTLDVRPLPLQPLRSDEILVHPGSGSPRKNWPPARFAEVVADLIAQGAAPRLIIGEADVGPAQAVEAALGQRLPRLDAPPLGELAARLAGCRAYLGNDSGVSHLAGLAGASTVALFGPTSPAVWRPLGARVTTMAFESPTSVVVDSLLGRHASSCGAAVPSQP